MFFKLNYLKYKFVEVLRNILSNKKLCERDCKNKSEFCFYEEDSTPISTPIATAKYLES